MKHIIDLLQHRTGFKPGSRVVTCPKCQVQTHGKFCGKCGHEITAINYEVLQGALQNGDITPEELTEGMEMIPGFREKSVRAEELIRGVLSHQRILVGA